MTAVLLALAAALAFAFATVAQHRGATDAADGGAQGQVVGLVRRLVRHPGWLAGQGAGVIGVVLHAVALHSGRLVVVAPLLSSGLVLALGIGAVVDRRHAGRPLPGRAQWAAAAAVAGGLTLFLLMSRPAPGVAAAPLLPTTVCAAAALVVAGAAALWGRRPGRPHRALVLGIAAGLGFGVAGLLMKEFVGQPLGAWPAWVAAAEMAAVGLVSTLLTQWAYQAGPLIESLPATTVLEPAVAVVLSGPLFAEWLAPSPLARAGQLVGALAAVAGLVVLGRRAAQRESAARPPAYGEPAPGVPALRAAQVPQPGRAV